MVLIIDRERAAVMFLSVLALSSRFDGRHHRQHRSEGTSLSVLALSSRFDGQNLDIGMGEDDDAFSTRSVESF